MVGARCIVTAAAKVPIVLIKRSVLACADIVSYSAILIAEQTNARSACQPYAQVNASYQGRGVLPNGASGKDVIHTLPLSSPGLYLAGARVPAQRARRCHARMGCFDVDESKQ